MSDPDLFRTAPAEVIRFFEGKRSVPTFDWRDIAPQEHAFSWTVAKSAGFDILDDIRDAVQDAITNRVPFEQFRTQLTPLLQSKGWWGQRRVTDPLTNVERLVQLGSPRRLQTIYWANTMTAHGAGEWARIERNKAFLPFLLYTLSAAERRRPEHEGWVGIVLPVEHPFWKTHYPPNGWGCMCGVRQISRQEAISRGWREGVDGPQIVYEDWQNRRTGEVSPNPVGIDPGWATNPGMARAENVASFIAGRIEQMPAYRQSIAIGDVVASPILKAMLAGQTPTSFFVPVAPLASTAVDALGAQPGPVRLSASSLHHIVQEHAERGLGIDDLRAAVSVASQPAAIVATRTGASIVMIGEAEGNWWRIVVKAVGGREFWLQSFHRKSRRDIERLIDSARRNGRLR